MDLDRNSHDEWQHEQQPGETVALNYIDKVHASLTKQWDAMSRSLTAQIVSSLITLAVCIGAVTPRENLSLLGVGLIASITTILIGTSFLIASFQAMALGALTRAGETKMALTRLYMKAGYQDETMDPASLEDPFGAATPLYTLCDLWLTNRQPKSLLGLIYVHIVGRTVFLGLTFLLPIVAEFAALLKAASLLGWRENLLWAILVIPIVVSVAGYIWTIAAVRLEVRQQ
jgi:hypothetical protein